MFQSLFRRVNPNLHFVYILRSPTIHLLRPYHRPPPQKAQLHTSDHHHQLIQSLSMLFGADCEPIKLNGFCYQPDTVLSHASYAFNSYWQKTKNSGGTCDFGGTAILVTVDPTNQQMHNCRTASKSRTPSLTLVPPLLKLGLRPANPCSSFAGVNCSSSEQPRRVESLVLGTGQSDSPGLAGILSPSIAKLTELSQLVLLPASLQGPRPSLLNLTRSRS
ncbi:Hypothetical predicted protein [Olea europaea subsp. europaea]|uniref:X8 domain-containing protein n=1 Tax=Olea europaea subsp. europaea TaxID=158383 RepID=A0A8S0RP97_OLEEU|nr:Hypothetical predicted protein [Olea europaea subsp. europaea]